MTNKLLNTGALILFSILILAVIISKFSSGHYGSSNADVLRLSTSEGFIMDYAELHAATKNAGAGMHDMLFIDLRSAAEFSDGHIPGAINVPARELLEKAYKSLFSSDKTKVLYSDQEMVTVHAAMLLLGKGYSAIRILPGNYDIMESHILKDNPDAAFMYYRDDKARFDYPRFMHSSGRKAGGDSEPKTPVVPQVSTGPATIQGGC